MKKKSTKGKPKAEKCCWNMESCSSGGFIYGLGAIGAAVYFVSTATGFWMGVLGVLKAIVWPAFLVFELLKFLGM